jgi:hypothetical protein
MQTLYTDTDNFDLVNCFMNRNINALKPHIEVRRAFEGFESYNWEADPLRLKPIREAAHSLPNSDYQEPNFVAIKNACERAKDLMETLAKSMEFKRCEEIKELKTSTEGMLIEYCRHPEGNSQLLERVEQNVAKIKAYSI